MYSTISAFRLPCLAAGISVVLGAFLLCASPQGQAGEPTHSAPLREAPATLFETGLYRFPKDLIVDPDHVSFQPQYPLWTDGAEKRRWISVPEGSAIDATNPDIWDFPIGTRLWKEFSFAGRKVETRFMERLSDGSWLFAAYGWSEDGKNADLVPAKGMRGAYPLNARASHTIPSVNDCRACHMAAPSPVLGFSAQQLAADDQEANKANVLNKLAGRGLLNGMPPKHAATDPRRVSPVEKAALGYLHGNCGHCHNTAGPLAKLGLNLHQRAINPGRAALRGAIGQPLVSPPPGLHPETALRIAPGDPQRSAIPQRMASRWPVLQMPPLGTAITDTDGLALINRWIEELETVSEATQHQEGVPK